MSNERRANLVDGLTTLRAAQQTGKEKPVSSAPSSGAETGVNKISRGQKPASKIRRTVLPSRNEIVCYQCEATFEIIGRSTNTVCPKCRARLDIKDLVINTEWAEEIITAGTVTIAPEGALKGGSLIANKIIVQGSIEGASVRASRLMELQAGCFCPEDSISCLDLVIGVGFELILCDKKKAFRNIQVLGQLEGDVSMSGVLHISTTGHFSGKVSCAGLRVEAGGALEAEVQARPAALENKKKRASLKKTA